MIAIVLFTCARPPERAEYALRALSTLDRLTAGDEKMWLHIADDGSSQEFRDQITNEARAIYGDCTSVSNSEGRGYGGNYNLATQFIHQIADVILPLEDDWEVQREFDLAPFVLLLRAGVFNCIRMGYIGYTDKLAAVFRSYDGQHYLELDPNSPEKHIFTGGPRLETAIFERVLGAWPEKLEAGNTELEVASRPEARQGVAWPISSIHPSGDLFVHIGTKKAETGAPGSQSPMQKVTP